MPNKMLFFLLPFLRIGFKGFLFLLLVFFARTSHGQELDSSLHSTYLYQQIKSYCKEHASTKPALILFASTHSCSKCYHILEKEFRRLGIDKNCQIILVIRIVPNPKIRREFIKKYPLFELADTLFFEDSPIDQLMETAPLTGVFGRLKIGYSPAILCFFDEEETYWSNGDIFDPKLKLKPAFKRMLHACKKGKRGSD